MALKSTVVKAELQISDMDRQYYAEHNLTLAQHPSETPVRLMARLIAFVLAFALFAAFMAVPTAILFGYVDAPMATGDYYPQFCDAIGSSAEHFAECATATH